MPVLAALPFCHSLGLYDNGLEGTGGNNDDAFEAMALRSGLAMSPSLRLLVSHADLPGMAAKRYFRGLPRVVMRAPEGKRLRVAAKAPSARFGSCALLPSPQIDAAPSVKAKMCPFYLLTFNNMPPGMMQGLSGTTSSDSDG